MHFVFQSEKVGLERQCRAKNDQLAVREAEVEQIPVLRNELEKLRVRISELSQPLPHPSLDIPPPYHSSLSVKKGGGRGGEGGGGGR